MSRPSTYLDLADYDRQDKELATFNLDEIGSDPKAMSVYAAFLAAVAPLNGKAVLNGTHVTVGRPKTEAELDEALAVRQRAWDNVSARYAAITAAIADGDMAVLDKWRDYEAYGLRCHAESEGLHVFRLIDANEDVRQDARLNLGMEVSA